MNKKNKVLVFLVLIIFGYGKANAVEINDTKPIKYIDAPLVIQDNQFWSSLFDYKITSKVTISASSSLSIENGTNISISNGAYFDVDGGILNIGFASTSADLLYNISSIGLNVDLGLVDSIFDGDLYKSEPSLNTKIYISEVGFNSVFYVNNGGVLNIRKADINGWPNVSVPNSYNDLERTLFGAYKKSKINVFETNINNVEVKGTEALLAYDYSNIVLYRSNINGFAGREFANVFNSSVLSVLRTKITDARVNNGFYVFNKGVLRFQKSYVSASPLETDSDTSGVCINGNNGTTVEVLNSDIGPCFIAFSFFGVGNFKVNQNNISGNGDAVFNYSPSVDFKNNWWGRSEGPRPVDLSSLDPDGNYSVSDYIEVIKNQNAIEDYSSGVISTPFSPVPFREVSPCCSNVLFIPGIQASRLYKKSLFGIENQLWEPNRNKDVEALFLNSNGQPKDTSVYTRDIIANTNFTGPLGSIDIYQSLINLLSKEKSDKNINDFQTLPYDWRMLPSNILSSGIKTDSYTVMLKDKIRAMAKSAPSGKVIIIAHSYGGLLAKSLMEDLEKEGSDLVESVVLVSVPEYGTPQSIPSLFYGDNEDLLGGLILSKATAMSLGRNMLSAHLLLPSSKYFTESDGVYNQKDIIGFDSFVSSKYKLTSNKIDSFGLMEDFLKNKNIIGINSGIFDTATTEHDLIDNYSPNLSSKTYSIVAVGIPTLSGLTYVKPKCRGFFFCSSSNTSLPDFTRKYSLMGDGVVIAHNLGKRTGSVFTVDIGKENEVKKTAPLYFREDPIAHKDVFRSSGVKDVLHAILSRLKKESEMINSFGVLSNPYVSYVSGSLSKPGPILGAYGNSSVFSGISKIAEDATDSDFVQRFSNSKVLVAEAYGPLVFKTNYKNTDDLLNLSNRIVNYTNYSDNNRSGVVSVVPSGFVGNYIFGQGSGVGVAQIVTKIDNKEIIYPNTSVTPSTVVDIDYSTTTIAIDNNGDGVIDKTIIPIQINDEDMSTSSESIDDLFVKAKARIKATSSVYLTNKYIEKLDIAQRKYQKLGVLQSLNQLKSFYEILESNMNTISNLIIKYNKEQDFYSTSKSKKVLFLNQRQKEIREEIIVYLEIHDAFAELIQGMGEAL
jgi:hypothetical protein